ncbi:MAG: hypothetical protein V5A61_08270, partial [Haloarculaceae archaeon]
MKSSVATASKDVLRIKLRAADFHAFSLLGRFAPWTAEREAIREVVLYPAFDSPAAFGDVLNRLGWYFPAGTVEDLDLTVSVRGDVAAASDHAPDAQGSFETDHLPLSNVDPGTLDERARTADRLLVWDADARLSGAAVRNAANVDVVDPGFYSHREPVAWGEVGGAARSGLEDRSRDLYASLERLADDRDTSYVFATGPSLDRAFEREFPEDALSVICNSIVRDDDLLEHLHPDVLTFADPVFHFGPSEYAVQFREDAVRAIREHDLVAVVPERYRELLVGHYPDLADHVVGIRSVYDDTFRFPTAADLEVMGTANIMTKFMLPVASALTDRVRIVGADGRKEDESYFWEHSDVGQYDDDLMNTAFETHPAFFRDRVYTDYYEQHVETLTEMIEAGESTGVTYESITPSYIP